MLVLCLGLQSQIRLFSFKNTFADALQNLIPFTKFDEGHYRGYFTNFDVQEFLEDVQPIAKMAASRFGFTVEGKVQFRMRFFEIPGKFKCNGIQRIVYSYKTSVKFHNKIECQAYGEGWFSSAFFKMQAYNIGDIVQRHIDDAARRLSLGGLDIYSNVLESWDGSQYRMWLIDSKLSKRGFGDFLEAFPGVQRAEYLSEEDARAMCVHSISNDETNVENRIKQEALPKLTHAEVADCLGSRGQNLTEIDGGFVWLPK